MDSVGNIDARFLLGNAASESLLSKATSTKSAQSGSSGRYSPEEEAGIRTQAKRFEAIFVKMMVDSMRENVPQDEMLESGEEGGEENDDLGGGNSRKIYQGMLDGEYAQTMVNSQSFGLADAMMRQFGVDPDGPQDSSASALSLMGGGAVASPTSAHAPTMMISPVSGKISSHFGLRNDPIDGSLRQHDGVDIAVPVGSTVRAAANGTVTFAGTKGAYGNTVEISHPNGTSTLYGHLDKISVNVGETVRRGQGIATSGDSGRSTGPHIHFEVRVNGRAADPADFTRLP